MPEPITPALTPEEWKERHPEWGTRPQKEIVTELASSFLPNRPHAAACILVFGQPFGFTQEDVGMLRSIAAWYASDSPYLAEAIELNELADRIAALLPPKE